MHRMLFVPFFLIVGFQSYAAIEPITESQLVEYADLAIKVIEDIPGKAVVPFYIDRSPSLPLLPSIQDPSVMAQDHENLIPIIEKYNPVVYLHPDEKYFPITAEEYCTGPQTAIALQTDDSILIPQGDVTMDQVYSFYESYSQKSEAFNLYFDITQGVTFGSDPSKNRDENNNLTTPCSVLTWETDDALYVQYLYLYGFNGPFSIGILHGDDFPVQDAHEADLEHVTLMIDKGTRELKKIYYSSHDRYEGMWLNADNPDIAYEGTHPVVFAARSSHGNYPREGTYIRIYGLGNDITGSKTRWTPILRRIYVNTDERFDPSIMGWCYHAGNLGKRGVSSPFAQAWFQNSLNEIGREYDTVPFCINPKSPNFVDEVIDYEEYKACILSKIPLAKIPE